MSERQTQLDLEGGARHVGSDARRDQLRGWHLQRARNEDRERKELKELSEKKVLQVKLQHYAQMQFGMLITGLPSALYVAENKDTNELYWSTCPTTARWRRA